MIKKQTWVNLIDNTNVKWLQVFHLYKGFYRKTAFIGFFIKGSAKKIIPPRIEYKGFKFKFFKKGDICRGLIIGTKYLIKRYDSGNCKYPKNTIIMIKKKQTPISKYLFGPAIRQINQKKILLLFKFLI